MTDLTRRDAIVATAALATASLSTPAAAQGLTDDERKAVAVFALAGPFDGKAVGPVHVPGEALVMVLDRLQRAAHVGEHLDDLLLSLRHAPFREENLGVVREMVEEAEAGGGRDAARVQRLQVAFRDGPWMADQPKWGAGRWCDCFTVKEGKITRLFIYLDPDYAGKDTARYGWITA